MNFFKGAILILCCFTSLGLFAQTPKEIEDDLLKSFKKINYYSGGYPISGNNDHYDYDSLERANIVFSEKILHYTTIFPSTISQQFKSFALAGLGVADSKDALLRIYFWNTGTGGTQEDYGNVIQYKTSQIVKSNLLDDGYEGDSKVPLYDTIYILNNNYKRYYLSVYEARMEQHEYIKGVRIFSIEKDTLNRNVKLIKTKTGLHNQLEYRYNNSFDDFMDSKRPDISYDEKFKVLKIPVVLENGKPNGNYIIYKFTGQYFERMKN